MTYRLFWGLVAFNLVFGIDVMRLPTDRHYLFLARFLPVVLVGFLFFALGVSGLIFILMRKCRWCYYHLYFGLALKAFWLWTLVGQYLVRDGVLFKDIAVWALLVFVQVLAIIYFYAKRAVPGTNA